MAAAYGTRSPAGAGLARLKRTWFATTGARSARSASCQRARS